MVMFLYREKYYLKDGVSQDNNPSASNIPPQYTNQGTSQTRGDNELEKVEVIIGKHRSGPTGKIELGFRPSYQQFVNVISNDVENRYPQ